jgi:hypothetical protein
MGADLHTPEEKPSGDASPGRLRSEDLKVRGDALVAKVKELLHEGNVRRITVKNDAGLTIMEIPVTAGVLAAVVAPILTAVAAVAALASNWRIEIHRTRDHEPVS